MQFVLSLPSLCRCTPSRRLGFEQSVILFFVAVGQSYAVMGAKAQVMVRRAKDFRGMCTAAARLAERLRLSTAVQWLRGISGGARRRHSVMASMQRHINTKKRQG